MTAGVTAVGHGFVGPIGHLFTTRYIMMILPFLCNCFFFLLPGAAVASRNTASRAVCNL